MAARSATIRRRIIACFVLSGAIIAIGSALGTVQLARSVLADHRVETALNRLGWAARQLEQAYAQGGIEAVRNKLPEIRRTTLALYCGVANPDGTYVAHTIPSRIGEPMESHDGRLQRWGNIQRVRFSSEQGPVEEYRLPLRHRGRFIGTFCMAVRLPSFRALSWQLLRKPALLLAVPLLVTLLGGLWLTRSLGSTAAVIAQLETLADSDAPQANRLVTVRPQDRATIGWNRLVRQLGRGSAAEGTSSVADALKRYQEYRSNEVLNSLPDGIAVTDAAGRVRTANTAFASLVGRSEDQVRGEDIHVLLNLRAHPDVLARFRDEHTLGRQVTAELEEDRGGNVITLRIQRLPLRTGSDEGYLWIVRDVTQQVLAQKMKTQFVYAATHELRTPLSNIRAYAETLALAETLDTAKQREFCNIINSEAMRLEKLIEDLLNLSRLEAAALSLNVGPVDLQRLVEEVITNIRPTVEKKRQKLRVRLPEKYFPATLDKDKIIVTLVNLLGNAVKYTPEEGEIRFEVYQTESHIRFVVEDTGIGIAPEDLPHVFEKFYRSRDPRVAKISGSGIGLALAKEIVELHGGRITVESELNRGTRFTVVLPAVAAS